MTETTLAAGSIGIALGFLFARIVAVERRLDRLSRLEAKVDILLKHSGLEFDAFHGVPPEVREALERGKTMLAIKRYRQATGRGLKDAKAFVDEVRRRRFTVDTG
ncbi:MAG: hypothetical protein ACRD1V_14910 [Vicinamibacterales bacterium]